MFIKELFQWTIHVVTSVSDAEYVNRNDTVYFPIEMENFYYSNLIHIGTSPIGFVLNNLNEMPAFTSSYMNIRMRVVNEASNNANWNILCYLLGS